MMARLLARCLASGGLTLFTALGSGLLLESLLLESSAAAADRVVVTSSPTVVTTPTTEASATLPNPYLLRSGLFTLSAAYVPALVVALESSRSADNRLYAPIVGPWLDLGDRGKCGDGCGSRETVNKVLLVTDGVFQGLGVLQIVSSFLIPTTQTLALHNTDGSTAVAFHVTPASFGSANGLMAVGEF